MIKIVEGDFSAATAKFTIVVARVLCVDTTALSSGINAEYLIL